MIKIKKMNDLIFMIFMEIQKRISKHNMYEFLDHS
jgi:hypothetical protein